MANVTNDSIATKDIQSIVSRVVSLSIFFVGVGLFAAIGLAMHQSGFLGEYQTTYFAVGVAIGIVGLLLWLVSR